MNLTNPRRVRRLATGILIALLFLLPIVYVVMISLESSAVPGPPPRAAGTTQRRQLRLGVAARGPRAAGGEHHHLFHLGRRHINRAELVDRLPRCPSASSVVVANIPVVRHRALPTSSHHPPVHRSTRPRPVRQPHRLHPAARGTGSTVGRDPADGISSIRSRRSWTRPPGWTAPATRGTWPGSSPRWHGQGL